MTVQKHQKDCWQKSFTFLNVYEPQTQIIKALNCLDSSRSYGKLLENPKPGAFEELFLSENDFKSSSRVFFFKKMSRFWRPENKPKT